jgi:hypothetical protein
VSDNIACIEQSITELEHRIQILDAERAKISSELDALRMQLLQEKERIASITTFPNATITNASSADAKIALIRNLFKGREDVFARRWTS